MTTFTKRLTKEQALPKIKHYCTYQERSHKEVKEKLYGFGLYKTDVEELMAQLIEEDYLNEERFAMQYAGGKFRMKQWGRVQIQRGLKERQVSTYCIRRAMTEISDVDYEKTLQRLAEKKWDTLKGEQYLSREGKTRNYLLQKGYEPALIQKAMANLKSNG
jgi:regulatory protein